MQLEQLTLNVTQRAGRVLAGITRAERNPGPTQEQIDDEAAAAAESPESETGAGQ